ncbi:hypothetical protein [Singulisphaera sp. PoT]|uniref:hypothetical protein n=1 Tax=Singulisphaera sp. PoT TaxID=3411797 RepID=UPI003BF464AC
MIDLSIPSAQPMLAAAKAMDAILRTAREMSVVSRKDRLWLQERIAPTFEDLRKLSREHFAGKSGIPKTLDALEEAIAQLAELPGVPDDGPPAKHRCPACWTGLVRQDKFGHPTAGLASIVYCASCVGLVMPSLFSLTSVDGGFSSIDAF